MGDETATTDAFESVLERGRRLLSTASDEYSAIEGTESLPSGILEARAELEQELDELDQTLEVTDADVEHAEQIVRRIAVLADVLSALGDRQRTVVEADVERLDRFLSGIAELVRDHDLEDAVEPSLDEFERKVSMLEKLIDSGRHRQVETNDRITPESLDVSIRQVDIALTGKVPEDAHAVAYLDITDAFLDDIHGLLSDLGDENDERTAYSSDLRNVKGKIADAEKALEKGANERAVREARIALEGSLSLHYLTARAGAEQQASRALAEVVEEFGLVVDCDVDRCVDRGDVDGLMAEISDVIASQVELSTGERLRQLLREHDGSVERTAAATDFDLSTIMDHLTQLYQDEQIADITVEFKT